MPVRISLLILNRAPLNRSEKTVSRLLMPLPNELILLSIVAVAGGCYGFILGFRLLARKRLLLNPPTSKIRSASLGLVEINGVASSPYSLPAPISGLPCFLYQTTAWVQSDESKTHEWKKVAEESLHIPFFVDDGTGQLLVDPHGAELDLHRDFRQTYSDTIFAPHAPPQVSNFLARHGATEASKVRIEERCIKPNDLLFIIGTMAENSGIEVKPSQLAVIPHNLTPTNLSLQPDLPVAFPEVIRLSEPSNPSVPLDLTQQSKVAAALTMCGESPEIETGLARVFRTLVQRVRDAHLVPPTVRARRRAGIKHRKT